MPRLVLRKQGSKMELSEEFQFTTPESRRRRTLGRQWDSNNHLQQDEESSHSLNPWLRDHEDYEVRRLTSKKPPNPFDSLSSSATSTTSSLPSPMTPHRSVLLSPRNPFDSPLSMNSSLGPPGIVPKRRRTTINPFDEDQSDTSTTNKSWRTRNSVCDSLEEILEDTTTLGSRRSSTSSGLLSAAHQFHSDFHQSRRQLNQRQGSFSPYGINDDSTASPGVPKTPLPALPSLPITRTITLKGKKPASTPPPRTVTPASVSDPSLQAMFSDDTESKTISDAGAKTATGKQHPRPFDEIEMSLELKIKEQQQQEQEQKEVESESAEQLTQSLDSSYEQEQESHNTEDSSKLNLTLHDLCDEAPSTDDIAWRNAVVLLSIHPQLASVLEPRNGMSPLHVCCLGIQPPPIWMTRALLYVDGDQARLPDVGGRLPLHLIAATCADLTIMQLLVEEYPAAVGCKDKRGFTPLHLLLKNQEANLTIQHLRILLGLTVTENDLQPQSNNRTLFRRQQHLKMTVQQLQEQQQKKEAPEPHYQKHEAFFDEYPKDVKVCLTKIKQWKRRQLNKHLQFLSVKDLVSPEDNPASIPTPSGKLLPLHLLVRRPIIEEDGNEKDGAPPVKKITLLRAMIAAYPEALMTRDAQGRTPIMTALLQNNTLSSQDEVELLLGLHISLSLPINSDVNTKDQKQTVQRNPAMLASQDTHQLPLHVAAEEFSNNFSLLSTIYEAFPGAKTVQDIRGRTPLHLALANYRSIPLAEQTLELLYSPQVATTKDDDGKIPLDLVMENTKRLKKPNTFSLSTIFQEFLDASIAKPTGPSESRDLLRQIRQFPPWLRRHACAAHYVQASMLEELASPHHTFSILLQGVVLVTLLIMLRRVLDSYGGPKNTVNSIVCSGLAVYHLTTQAIYWISATCLSECYYLCVSRPWRWIDIMTGCLPIVISYIVEAKAPVEDDTVIRLGTVATIVVGLSLLGFLMEWWYGMAVFCGYATKLATILFWPCIAAAMLIVVMAHVLITIFHVECLDELKSSSICTVREAYTTTYLLLITEPIVSGKIDDNGSNSLTTEMLVVMTGFTLVWVWLLVSAFVMTLSEAKRLDRRQIAVEWFWEPKVALNFLSGTQSTPKLVHSPPSWVEQCYHEFEMFWYVLVSSIQGVDGRRELHWYARWFQPGWIIVVRIMALFLIPIWFCWGVVTLGLLWPPQVRQWLFATDDEQLGLSRQKCAEEIVTASKLSQLKSDVQKLKSISYEQSYQLHIELEAIKQLLSRAMEEQH